MELTVERIPRLVELKPKVSVWTSHRVPRARSQGNWSSRWSFTEIALSGVGTDSMILLELEIQLVNRNPSLESSARSSDTSDIALVSPLMDFKQSSTYKIAPYSSHCLCAERFLIIICRLLYAKISATRRRSGTK